MFSLSKGAKSAADEQHHMCCCTGYQHGCALASGSHSCADIQNKSMIACMIFFLYNRSINKK